VIACADARHRVPEVSDTNNCRATRTVRVLATRDETAPTFAGLETATTCIPGPVRPDTTASYLLTWDAAADDVTPPTEMVYDVYQATQAGGETFSSPTYTTEAGATSFVTPQLPAVQTFYFVVRVRDSAGNRDANTIEHVGVNVCV
jgi:hypothetical protein